MWCGCSVCGVVCGCGCVGVVCIHTHMHSPPVEVRIQFVGVDSILLLCKS